MLQYLAVQGRRGFRRSTWNALARVGAPPDLGSACLLWDTERIPGARPLADYLRTRRATGAEPSYVFDYRSPVVIEPRFGYAITPPAHLIDLSLTHGYMTHTVDGRTWVGLPSVSQYLRTRLLRRGRVVREGVVASLASPWPENYYHFITDVVPKLVLMDACGVGRDVPLLVLRGLAETRFFREALTLGRFPERRFLVTEDDTFVETGELIFANSSVKTFLAETLLAVRDYFGVAADGRGERRLFITRSPARGRTVTNFSEIEDVLERYGFEVVDTDGLSLRAQIDCFAGARYVAGIHGAGLVNMLFRAGQPLDLLELHPPEKAVTCFEDMAGALGFGFVRLMGVDEGQRYDKRAPFAVDPRRFAAALGQLVGEPAYPVG
jgi:hypothetical protein